MMQMQLQKLCQILLCDLKTEIFMSKPVDPCYDTCEWIKQFTLVFHNIGTQKAVCVTLRLQNKQNR